MNRNRLFVVSGIVLVALLTLLWYTRKGTPTPKVDGKTAKAEQTPSGSNAPRTRPERMGQTSRPATEKDVPRTSEEARARPEVERNKSMADVRSAFAAGRHDEVITQAKNILAADPEREQVRAFLAMSWCALGREAEAREAYEQLPAARKTMVATRCHMNHIDLPPP